MTKQEFENHSDPLVMIVSLNPSTGKVLYDTYPYNTAEGWMENFVKEFPDYIHFRITNKAGVNERRKMFGLKEA